MATARGPDNSGKLFDNIKKRKKLSNDGALAEFIEAHRSEVSEIRHGKREISDVLLVRICDKAKLSLAAARAQIADRD